MSNLQVTAELQDKMSGPLKNLASLWGEFAQGVAEGAKAELEAQKATDKLADSQKKMTKETNEAAKAQGGLVESLKGLGVALAAIGGVAAIFEGFKNAVGAADALDDLSDKTGIAASSLKQYELTAKLSGTSLDGMISGLRRLNRSMAMSEEESSKQAAAFKALNISMEDAKGNAKTAEQVFGDVADKFKDLEDGPNKAALAVAIFGQKGQELIPMLNKGSAGIAKMNAEAQALGAMGPDAFNAFAAESGNLFDNIDKLVTIFTNFFQQMAAEIVPVLNVFADAVIKSYTEGGLLRNVIDGISAVFANVFVPVLKGVAIIVNGLAGTITVLGKGIGALGAIIAAVASGDMEGARRIFNDYKSDVAQVGKEMADFQKKTLDAGTATEKTAEVMTKKAAPAITKVGKEAKETTSELAKMRDELDKQVTGFNFTEASKKALDAMQKYREDIKKGIAPEKALADLRAVLGLITQLDEKTKQREAEKAEAAVLESDSAMAQEIYFMETALKLFPKDEAARAKYITQLKDEYEYRKKLYELDKASGKEGSSSVATMPDGTRTYSDEREAARARLRELLDVQKQNEELAKRTEELAKRTEATTKEIIAGSYDAILEDVRGKLEIAAKLFVAGKIEVDDWVRYAETQTKRLEAFNKEAADEITLFWQEAAKNMQSAMGDFFFDVMQGKISSLGDRFKQMLDRMVADALAANLAEALFGKGFSKTGNLGGWVGQGLSWLGGFFGGTGRAIGGDVMAGGSYMVGEKGPEPFIPKVSGTIIPTGSILANYGAGKGSNVNFNITAMDSQDVARAIHNNRRQIAEIINGTNRGYGMGV